MANVYMQAVQRLVEGYIEHPTWRGTYADCDCPLGHEARVYIDRPIPFLHCLHEKCADDVRALNEHMREAAMSLPECPARLVKTPKQKAEEAFKKRLRRLERDAREYILPDLRRHSVPVEHWTETSPVPVEQYAVEDHWMLFLCGLFPLKKLIWAGHLWQSGPAYQMCFNDVEHFLLQDSAPGPYVSAFTFRWPENGRRCRKNTEERILQVLESDTESQETFGAVMQYASKYMTLRAVTDTGGKSLHAAFEPFRHKWVEFPAEPQRTIYTRVEHTSFLDGKCFGGYHIQTSENDNYAAEMAAWNAKYGAAWRKFSKQRDQWIDRELEFYAILRGLGCDRHMLSDTLTTRLPGHPRLDDEGNETGRWQQLLYLNAKYDL